MSDKATPPGLWPIHGDGVLARQGDLVLLVHPAGGILADRLLDLLTDAARAGEDGRRFADRVSAAFDADAATAAAAAAADPADPADPANPAGGEPHPAAVAFGPAGAGAVITSYGTAWAEVTTAHGVRLLTAGQPYDRLRCVLTSEVTKIRAGVRPDDENEQTDRYLRLADGIVRADALVYAADNAASPAQTSPAPAPPAPAPAAPESAAREESRPSVSAGDAGTEVLPAAAGAEPAPVAPPQDFIAVSFLGAQADGGAPARDALPLGAEPPDDKDLGIAEQPIPVVMGVYCKNGHFNDPEARYCAVCGIGMAQLTKTPRAGKRPPLGVLVLDDGSVFQLDADYVIGREPSLDSAVADGSARPLRCVDASGLVSRIHARVELDGWQVFVSDLDSANGTHIRLPGEQTSRRLAPRVRAPLVVGAEVRLGTDYGFRYDSHRHR